MRITGLARRGLWGSLFFDGASVQVSEFVQQTDCPGAAPANRGVQDRGGSSHPRMRERCTRLCVVIRCQARCVLT
jgi:hypothetical protein